MKLAMEEHEELCSDDLASDLLLKYFTYTAHYIVAASEYMRPDQVGCVIAVWHGLTSFVVEDFATALNTFIPNYFVAAEWWNAN